MLSVCATSVVFAASLDMPTLALRQQAHMAFAAGNLSKAEQALIEAQELAQQQPNPYVKANELRYIADAWARMDKAEKAQTIFAESMEAAIAIPTWNHRLYASIGVVEMQRATGDLSGTYANGMKALNSGLLEAIAKTGQAAEMGRFFTALDGLLTKQQHDALKQKITGIGSAEFQSKAIHAINSIEIKGK